MFQHFLISYNIKSFLVVFHPWDVFFPFGYFSSCFRGNHPSRVTTITDLDERHDGKPFTSLNNVSKQAIRLFLSQGGI